MMIYSKSEKGQLEIDTRSYGLSPVLRHVLILVDGKSSIEELSSKMMQDVNESLTHLLEAGFIRPSEVGSGSHVAGLKQELIATAEALLGKHAERVVQKIDSAPNDLPGMKAAVDDCQKFVRLFIDEKQAASLFDKCHSVFQKYA
ncbi:MAG: hypothetical protein OEX12_08420 [Gammaproteobacteria bacterium]|nr:hypothetical protein [Gammaproteobacteria bacterium]